MNLCKVIKSKANKKIFIIDKREEKTTPKIN